MEISPNPRKFRVNFLQQNPLKTSIFHFIILLVLARVVDSAKSSSIQPRFLQIPYSQYCNDVVPESASVHPSNITLALADAIFAGGAEILRYQNNSPAGHGPAGAASFRSQFVFKTQADQVFKLEGRLVLKGRRDFVISRRLLRMVSYRPPRIPVRPRDAVFRLHGFWSAASGKLCMVGSGVSFLRSVNVVLKLDYRNVSNISSSFVNGRLGNLGHEGDLNYFKPIEVLGVSIRGYNYTLIESEKQSGVFSGYDELKNVSLGFETSREVCSVIRYAGTVELDYLDDCGAVNCKFLGEGSESLPDFMTFDEVECLENGRVRYLLRFSDSSYHSPFDPSTTLVAEGEWDKERNNLGLVACRIVNATESLSKSSVGNCSIRLILRVPSSFSLRNRSIVVGQMWSKTMSNDSGSFGRISFRSQGNKNPRFLPLKYKYGEYDNVGKTCVKEIKVKRKGRVYPDGHSSDMRFDMTVRNKKRHTAWGYSSPLSVGDKFYQSLQVLGKQIGRNQTQSDTLLNISYVLSFKNDPSFKLGGGIPPKQSVEISAEGIYDAKTGFLCMIGCRHLSSHDGIQNNKSSDCDIVVIAELPPLNAKNGGNVKGVIQSTRNKADPHYFDTLEFLSDSIYTSQAKQSIWRMDLEITMVLVSSTLACIFVGLQLIYVHKHPYVLPLSSIVMLVILTLGHMIPLLLNFEAVFFSNHRRRQRQTLLTGNDGWLEVNEVLVRVITMIVFLMELRLLQLSWSARDGDENQTNLWVSDKRVLYLSLPLYIGGGLIAWFVHLLMKPYQNALPSNINFANSKQISFLGELKSYAGLVLDGFLLPQIIFNFFCDSKAKALAPSFYIGTTLLRLLPHAYDLYRAHTSSWSFTYIYANPGMDYYSTVWDIIICFCGILFAFIIFLQQWFGGRFFLPRRYREISYEKVPVAGTE